MSLDALMITVYMPGYPYLLMAGGLALGETPCTSTPWISPLPLGGQATCPQGRLTGSDVVYGDYRARPRDCQSLVLGRPVLSAPCGTEGTPRCSNAMTSRSLMRRQAPISPGPGLHWPW